jgi:hypothetical protein
MTDTSYYIYSLKDSRQSPAMPFYIGKGTGTRAWDHVARVDRGAPLGTPRSWGQSRPSSSERHSREACRPKSPTGRKHDLHIV